MSAHRSDIGRLAILVGNHSLMIMLRAHLDESGHSKDPSLRAVAVGGAIASLEGWEAFEPQWKSFLLEFGVSELHMKDYAHSAGEFSGWKNNEPQRRAFISQALAIINQHVSFFFGHAVSLDAIERLPMEARKYLRDPYYPCLQACFESIARYAKEAAPQEQVELIVAQQPEFTGKLDEFLSGCKHVLNGPNSIGVQIHGLGDMLGTLSVIPSDSFGRATKKVVQLQVADLVAYENAHHCERYFNDKSAPFRWPLQQLGAKPHRFSLFEDEGLRDGFY